jgi:hypothetical protein
MLKPKPIELLFRYVRGSMLVLMGLSAINTAMACVAWDLARRATLFGEPLELSDYDFISEASENLTDAAMYLSFAFLIIWIVLILRARANSLLVAPGLKPIRVGWFIASLFMPIVCAIVPILLMRSIWQGSALKSEREQHQTWDKIPVPWYFYASILVTVGYTGVIAGSIYSMFLNPFRAPADYWRSASWDVAIQFVEIIEYAFALVVTWSLFQRHTARLKEFEEEQKASELPPAVPSATV